jgi:hypothetical protein
MKQLKYKESTIQFDLERLGDLLFFEGPLLSVYKDVQTNKFYLMDWVDRDQDSNRWLFYSIKKENLSRFINREISHFDLYENDQKSIYFVDIKHDAFFDNTNLKELDEMSQEYIPSRENYFNSDEARNLDKILDSVNKRNKYKVSLNILNYKDSYLKNKRNHLKSPKIREEKKVNISIQNREKYTNIKNMESC